MTRQLQQLLKLQEIDVLLVELETAAPGRAKEEILAERASIARGVRPEVLERYEVARRRHRRPLASTRRGVCLGCFTVRPTALVKHGRDLETCERCGRILVPVEEALQAAEPALPPPRAKGRRGASSRH
jgi:predicted  nucleic acid-binding Zn-ribbon protein